MGTPRGGVTRRDGTSCGPGNARGSVIVARTIFVALVLTVAWGFALQSPLYAAALYLWIAYSAPSPGPGTICSCS